MLHQFLETTDGPVLRIISITLLHSLWIGLMMAALASLTVRFIPSFRQTVRYRFLLIILVTTFVSPPIATLVQQHREARSVVETAQHSTTVVVTEGRSTDRPRVRETTLSKGENTLANTPVTNTQTQLTPILATILRLLEPIIVAGWAVLLLLLLGLLGLGSVVSTRYRRNAVAAPRSIQLHSDQLARQLGLSRSLPVLLEPGLKEPLLCGLFKPIVLFPESWIQHTSWSRLEAILAHELSHAKRRDLLINLGQRLIEAFLFFHPAVLWISRRLRCQRELCTDALAISVTGNPVALAEALESVARHRRAGRRIAIPLGTMLSGDELSLLTRIQELLGMKPNGPSPTRLWPFVAIPTALLILWFSGSLTLAQSSQKPSTVIVQAVEKQDGPSRYELPNGHKGFPIPANNKVKYGGPIVNHNLVVQTEGTPLADRQISFEVRFGETEASPLRTWLKDKSPACGKGGVTYGWSLNEQEVLDLLTVLQKSKQGNLIQAPKVTAFEGVSATIKNSLDQYYISGLEEIHKGDSLAMLPEIDHLELGTTVTLKGTVADPGIMLDVHLHDNAVIAHHQLTHRAVSRDNIPLQGVYQVPTTKEQQIQHNCTMPSGSTVLVSLGVYESDEHEQLDRIAEAAVGLLQITGLPPLRLQGETMERFVLITPRRIILENEEGSLGVLQVQQQRTTADE